MPESGTSGSVRGARGNSRPYREREIVQRRRQKPLQRTSGNCCCRLLKPTPAPASRMLRPVGLLNRPKAAFVTRLRPARLPGQVARQLPGPTDNTE